MSSLGDITTATARKPHRCSLCEYLIEPTTIYKTWTLAPGMHDADDWYTGKIHVECDAIYMMSELYAPWEPLPDYSMFRALFDEIVEFTSDTMVWSR